MNPIRVGVIGIGNMGSSHAKRFAEKQIPDAVLTAVCDHRTERLDWAKANLGDVKIFAEPDQFFKAKCVDAVVIATPHYSHPDLAIAGLNHDLHVLVEKPAGVFTKQVRQMNAVAAKSNKVFGMMFNQRTNPLYQKLRDLIKAGELGEIKRIVWIITNWYRSQSYYDSGGWRATWAGEGGGVLLNQDPHQLDLWQWICGMPKRVRAFCYFGKYHDIEVEDDVTAFVEYENGATGLFVTSTGEAPGTNRFEISGNRGKIVVEDDKLTFWRLRIPERRFNAEYKGGFGSPEVWRCEVPIKGKNTQHLGVLRNWIDAVCKQTPLLAPGSEGIYGLELSNAMHLSAWTDSWIELPLDEDVYYQYLQARIKDSKWKNKGED